MCQVIVAEGLLDEAFVRTQTDLSLVVRTDTERFLRASDLPAGRDDQFFHLDDSDGRRGAGPTLVPEGYGPRSTARLRSPWPTGLRSGPPAHGPPARAPRRLPSRGRGGGHRHRRRDDPELARKVATRRTKIWMGMSANKAYHSDLYQRTMLLLLALTGNWGRVGTGYNSWASGQIDGWSIQGAKSRPGVEGAEEVLGVLDGRRGRML